MKKFLTIAVVSASVSVFAGTDVTGKIEALGNPNGTTMDSRGRANTPWAMQAFDGGVYVGYGDYDDNSGPIPAWRYDCAQQKWINEGNLADEQIAFFYEFSDGNLYAPGIDDHGNYTLTGHVFRRKRGNPVWDQTVYTVSAQGQHNFSMAEYPRGRLWTAGYGICYADNYGNTTASEQWNKAVINEFSYPTGEQTADGIRIYPFVPFVNGLIVSLNYNYNTGQGNSLGNQQQYWRYNEESNEWDSFRFPFAEMFPDFENVADKDKFSCPYYSTCQPGKSLIFNGRTFYGIAARGSDYVLGVPWSGLWSATLENGRISAKRLAAFPVGDAPVDFFVHDGRLYTLSMTYTSGADTITWHIRRTADGENFTELYSWNASQVYRCFAFQDGAIYLGVWTLARFSGSQMAANVRESLKLGTICRFAAREVDTPFDTTGATVTTARGAVTVSLPIANLVGEATLTMKVAGEVIRSETATFADGIQSATKSGLRVGSYPVEVTMTVGDDTKTWSLTATVTDSDFLELGLPSATVANDGKSATISVEVLSLPFASATLRLQVNNGAPMTRTVSQKGREVFTIIVAPGSNNSFVFSAQGDGQTAGASGSFIAAVFANWFTVNFANDGYDRARWTEDAGTDPVVFDEDAKLIRLQALSATTYTPSTAGELGADTEIAGRCEVRGTYTLEPPDNPNAISAIGFLSNEENGNILPALWDGGKWDTLASAPVLTEGGWIDFRLHVDFASPLAPRVRATIAADGSAEWTSDWVGLASAQGRMVNSVKCVGEGAVSMLVGDIYTHTVHGVLELPKPVFAPVTQGSQRPPLQLDNHAFSITLGNAAAGFWYTAYASTDLTLPFGQWTPVACVPASANGNLPIDIPINSQDSSMFVRIVVSDAAIQVR